MVKLLDDLTDLGAAAVTPAELAVMLGCDSVQDISVQPVDYAQETMLTGGRFWVSGLARTGTEQRRFRVIVKIAQSVLRSPIMAQVPEHMRQVVAQQLPWQVEPNFYRSAPPLPTGLQAPAALLVRDLDDQSAAMWLSEIVPVSSNWDRTQYAAAGHLLGQLAASEPLRSAAAGFGVASGPHQARDYWEGRLQHQFVAAYSDGGIWQHPVLAELVSPQLRARLLQLAERAPALIDEIEALPLLAGHGDACPNNLLPLEHGFGLIDWALFGQLRLGFDLSQLVISRIELGQADGATLPDLQAAVLPAYRAGLAAAGVSIGEADLARAHHIQLAMWNGLALVPFELLDNPPELARHITVSVPA